MKERQKLKSYIGTRTKDWRHVAHSCSDLRHLFIEKCTLGLCPWNNPLPTLLVPQLVGAIMYFLLLFLLSRKTTDTPHVV